MFWFGSGSKEMLQGAAASTKPWTCLKSQETRYFPAHCKRKGPLARTKQKELEATRRTETIVKIAGSAGFPVAMLQTQGFIIMCTLLVYTLRLLSRIIPIIGAPTQTTRGGQRTDRGLRGPLQRTKGAKELPHLSGVGPQTFSQYTPSPHLQGQCTCQNIQH